MNNRFQRLANCSFFFFFEIINSWREFSYQFVAVVIDKHFARTFNEYNSPVTTHATGPHEQAKKKMSKKKGPFSSASYQSGKRRRKRKPLDFLFFFFFFFISLLSKERDKRYKKTYKYKQKQSQHAVPQYYPPKPPSP